MELTHLTRPDIDKILDSQETCLLVFSKDNCPICKRLKPTLEKIADDFKDSSELAFYEATINEPEVREVFKGWQLAGVPQTCLIKKGEFQEALPGSLEESVYRKEIDILLGRKKGLGAKLKSLFGK